jgi:hypothetical protein
MWSRCVSLALCALLTLLARTSAQPTTAPPSPCAAVAYGDYNSCYTLSSQCHYDLSTAHCIAGAPQICQQFVTYAAGCTGSSLNCLINNNTGICSPKSPGLTTCQTAYSTQSTCSLHGCYWDQYTNLCWDSLAQDNQYNNCSTWALYDTTGAACNSHLCSYNAGICTDIGSTSSSNNQNGVVTYTSNVNFVNPTIAVASGGANPVVSLTFQVVTPLVLDETNPTWGWLDLGLYNAPTTYASVPACTTFNSGTASPVAFSLATYNTNITQITPYIINWINTNKNMQWDRSSNGQAAAALLGNQTAQPFITSIQVQSSALVYTVVIPLSNYISMCGATGLQLNVTTQGNLYTVPVTYNTQQPNTGAVGAVDFFYASISTTGTASLSATSPYFTTVTLATANVAPHACPVNQSSMYTAYYLTYTGVYDTTQQVGPRNIGDIYVTLPLSGTTVNCYGDTPNKFTFLGCSNNTCVYYVDFYSGCYTLAGDGSTFTTCAQSQALAASHSFYVDTYSCPLGQPTSTSCVSINASPNTLSPITSTVSIKALPGSSISQSYTVAVGLLPTPTDTNVNDITYFSIGSVASNNAQLYSNQVLTVIASFNNTALNSALDLQIVPSSIVFKPVGPLGNAATYTNATSNSTILNSVMSYVPKDAQYQSPSSVILPLVASQRTAGVIGYDGFAVATNLLKQLLPANGYLISFSYIILVRGAPSTVNKFSVQSHHHHHHVRALLQTATNAPTTYTQEQGNTGLNITLMSPPDPDFTPAHGAQLWAILFGVVALTAGSLWLSEQAATHFLVRYMHDAKPHTK